MNQRQKIIVSITGIFIVLLALVGLTYAYFLTRITGNENEKSISVTTANLELIYEDGNGILKTGMLEPSDDYIKFLDNDGNEHESKIFTVTNNGNAIVKGYKVYLENIQNQLERKDDLVYILSCKAYTNYGKGTQSELETGCNEISTETSFPDVITAIVSNDIDVGITHKYELKAKYKEMGVDQSTDMNKTISAKLNIYDAKTKFLAREIIENARNSTNGTVLDLTQETLPRVGNEVSRLKLEKSIPTTFNRRMSYIDIFGNEIAYACDYTISEDGKYTLGTDECPVNKIKLEYIWTENQELDYDQMEKNLNEIAGTIAGQYVHFDNYVELASTSIDNLNNLERITTDITKITLEEIYFATVVPEKVGIEKILSTDYDDLGVSYYFRGIVGDNYVNFAEMCWRIVRIEGNGNVKLILEDQDQLCDSKDTNGNLNMNGNWDIEASDGITITMNGSEPYRTGNFGYDDSSGKNIMNYLNPIDYSNRAMVNAFKYFQTNTLKNKISSTYVNKTLNDYLESGNWCLNDKAFGDNGAEILEKPDYSSSLYYDSYKRLYSKKIKEPTLKCPVEPMSTYGDKETPMFVGNLTADEIVYAGGKVSENNEGYYLVNSWQKNNSKDFWTLSPYWFLSWGWMANAFSVNSDGRLGGNNVNDNELSTGTAFRPTISLKSNTKIVSGGEGTISNPYVVE